MGKLPDKSKMFLTMALGFTMVQAGVEMMNDLFDDKKMHDELNGSIPKEWPFQLSLDELNLEVMACMHYYKDLAIAEIAEGLRSENDNG
jgi:hypothetical protein